MYEYVVWSATDNRQPTLCIYFHTLSDAFYLRFNSWNPPYGHVIRYLGWLISTGAYDSQKTLQTSREMRIHLLTAHDLICASENMCPRILTSQQIVVEVRHVKIKALWFCFCWRTTSKWESFTKPNIWIPRRYCEHMHLCSVIPLLLLISVNKTSVSATNTHQHKGQVHNPRGDYVCPHWSTCFFGMENFRTPTVMNVIDYTFVNGSATIFYFRIRECWLDIVTCQPIVGLRNPLLSTDR
jgi:hypothetical protein